MRPLPILLTFIAILGAPATAFAGSAAIVVPGANAYDVTLVYSASPGERNQVVVTREGNAVVLHDAGAAVAAGAGCTSSDARTVRCAAAVTSGPFPTQPVPRIVIYAGDGDDTVVATPDSVEVTAYGGAGDDQLAGSGELFGGAGRDVLRGSDRESDYKGSGYSGDTLVGGPGDDVLQGGGGDDTLVGDGDERGGADLGGGNDVIDGGAGVDFMPYTSRATAVRVDLASGTATGAGGERDGVTGIENVKGGAGDDVLLGDGARNRLEGGPGSDRLYGRGGDDRLGNLVGSDAGADALHGGGGADVLVAGGKRYRLYGGSGNDELEGLYSAFRGTTVMTARTVRCGSGRDTVRGEPRGQLLSDCEVLAFSNDSYGPTISVVPQARRGRLRLRAKCTGPGAMISCDIRLKLRVDRSAPARRSVVIPNRHTRSLIVKPHRRARHGRTLRISLSGGLKYPRGTTTWRPSWRVRVK